jgi:predicted amidohydrolase YtcJ
MTNKTSIKNVMIWNGIDSEFKQGNLLIRDKLVNDVVYYQRNSRHLPTKWIVPAFTDSHIHLVNYAIARKHIFLDGLSLENIQKKIQETTIRTPPNRWIRGRGWEISHRKQGGFPDRMEIDSITLKHPVALSSKDGHAIWLNSCAMSKLELTDDILDPPGGKFIRREDGSLSGVALENAVEVIRSRIPVISKTDIIQFVEEAIRNLHAKGIVAVHSFEGISELDLLISMAESGKLPLKILSFFNLDGFETILSRSYRFGDKLHGVQMGGLKLFADGALGSRTAAISRPYSGEPDNMGVDVMSFNQLKRESIRAGEHGFPTAIHAIGDRAVNHALRSLIAVRKMYPALKGLRIEHAQLIAKNDLNKFHKYDIAVSVQPCHMISDVDMVERYWTKQEGYLYPYNSLDVSGAKIVFGSDAPIDDETPMHHLDAAVYRQKFDGNCFCKSWIPEECMNPVNAYKANTSTPALLEVSSERGCLIPGYSADFLILNRNPFELNARHTNQTIDAVFMDGKQIV